MTPETNKPTNAAENMRIVRAAWTKAASGSKKDAADKLYRAAETAHSTKNAMDTHWSLDAATRALK